MSYGFEVYNSNGALQFSSLDETWTVLAYFTSPANTNRTHNGVPDMPTRLVVRQMINQITGDDEAYVHTYVLSGNTLYTYAPSSTETVETFFTVFGK